MMHPSVGRFVLAYYILCFFFMGSTSEPLYYNCPNTSTYNPNTTYRANLNFLLSTLSSNATRDDGFYNFTAGSDGDTTVYGLFMCRGDVSTRDCEACVKDASADILQLCPKEKTAIIWYDFCMLRYSDKSMFGRVDQSVGLNFLNAENASEPQTKFTRVVGMAFGQMTTRAAAGDRSGKKFATQETDLDEFNTIYCLVQCTPDLSDSDCQTCLRSAIEKLYASFGGRLLFPSCSVRYEGYPFYNSTAASAPPLIPAPPPNTSPTPEASVSCGYEGYFLLKLQSLAAAVEDGCCRIDLQSLVQTKRSGYSRSTCCLQESNSRSCEGKEEADDEHGNNGSSSKVIIAIIVPAVGITLFISIFCFLRIRNVKKRNTTTHTTDVIGVSAEESSQYDFVIVQAITNDFSPESKIGEGGYGPVYKGMLQSGQEVAVKRLSRSSGQGAKEFKNEVEVVVKLQHRNLAWEQWRDGTPLEILDPVLAKSYKANEVIQCIHIGLLCVQDVAVERPTMAEVMLSSYSSNNWPSPREPAFYHGGSEGMPREPELEQPMTVNVVSISELYPR
nr:cysteine-rich receptor-like protein kinase 25 [Ipomoea batatas]